MVWSCIKRRYEGNVLRKALTFKIDGLRKKGRSKVEWTNKIVSEISKVGLKREMRLIGRIGDLVLGRKKASTPQHSGLLVGGAAILSGYKSKKPFTVLQ